MCKIFCFFICILFFCGCAKSENDDFRAVPITNNPNIVPNYGSGIPGMPDISR